MLDGSERLTSQEVGAGHAVDPAGSVECELPKPNPKITRLTGNRINRVEM